MQTSGLEICDHDVTKYTQSVGEDDRILSDVFCIGIESEIFLKMC